MNSKKQVQITLDNQEIANLLSQILSTVAHSTATLIINIFSSPTTDVRSSPDISLESILEIPQEGKYSQVRRYIQERCRFDPDFKQFINNSSRVEICRKLTQLFEWYVDDKSLGRNLNRHR